MSALAVLAAVTPSPRPTVDPDLVTPGPLGFTAIALVAVAVFLLVFDMLRRVRLTRYRAEANAAIDAEEAERAERDAQERSGTAEDAGGRAEDPTPER
ncbi:hypothetical protein N8K70_06820 [Microbacterium betulae]|uniref:Uncharacterized protein n=1 Tax=Microbacterium betulae TaxID=2981139 RepID=A0AA97I6Z7_9MICO|nr:hypothetical protein [Microbacterium sp. AB]WOF24374.1 hypothetical protein N8K70_06820 [Microbacterium sp. AB]